MRSYVLLVVAGPDKDKIYHLRSGPDQVLGRSHDCAYRLTDPRASRGHCKFRWEGDQVCLNDLGSTFGTFVNGIKVTDHVLAPGDTIRVGETVLRFQDGDPGASTVTDQPGWLADLDETAVAQLDQLNGRLLGHYEIGAVLGRGESALVFRARDIKNNQSVALKVMDPAFSRDEEDVQRFVRAMTTVLPLHHPNLVGVYEAGQTGPYCWIAMELVEGENMAQVIRRIGVAGMLDWRYAYRVAVHIARALDYAHAQHILHRNVTPTNILMQAADKQVKLGDLMLAKALEGSQARNLTRPGELLGDVNYLSPERTHGSSGLDGRSDLFSLGATVYALLTGRPPFRGGNVIETVANIRNNPPERPTKFQLSIPALFEGVVLKLLAKVPDERYSSAADLLAELERVGRFGGATA
jgi:serine/threonine protein kinase